MRWLRRINPYHLLSVLALIAIVEWIVSRV